MTRGNDSIFQTNCDLIKGKRPMGTTLCAALIRPHFVCVGNVGDSRAYLFRDGRFISQTEDHSWVDEQVKQGLMTQAAADKDNRRNLVTRCIGTHEKIEVDTYMWHVETGDQILLCTDGLINMVEDVHIEEVLQKAITTQEKVDELIALANANGGKDNVTVVLAWVDPNVKALRAMRAKAWLRKQQGKIRLTLLLSLFGFACFLAGFMAGFLFR